MNITIRDNGVEHKYRYFMNTTIPLISEDKESFCGKLFLQLNFYSDGETYWMATLVVHDEDDYDEIYKMFGNCQKELINIFDVFSFFSDISVNV